MTLTIVDLLCNVATGVTGYICCYGIFRLNDYLRDRRQVRRNEALVAQLRAHPRYPFNLPVVETWPAGEFICESCGVNNYFSLIKVDLHRMPKRMREAAEAKIDNLDEMFGMGSKGFYSAPPLLRCKRCKMLLANGEVEPNKEVES